MTDYEKQYQRSALVCGAPFPEFAAFFESAEAPLSVLDLGCGQGRDALMAARLGHRVLGVDLAPTGVAQMLAAARSERLDVEGEVADIETYDVVGPVDVVVLDRVLHMLETDEARLDLLRRVGGWVEPAGFVLVADTRKHRTLIRAHFSAPAWETVLRRGDFLFVRRRSAAAS